MTNKEFAKTDKFFQACCDAAEVKATKREASRFKVGKGKAHKIGKPIVDSEIEASRKGA